VRQYQPIWEEIKKKKMATIVAPAFSHKKIIQAVMKERCEDLAFRNLLRKKNIVMRLEKEADAEKGLIEFRLVVLYRGTQIEDL